MQHHFCILKVCGDGSVNITSKIKSFSSKLFMKGENLCYLFATPSVQLAKRLRNG